MSSTDSLLEYGLPQSSMEVLRDLAMHSPEAFDALMQRLGPLAQSYNEGHYFHAILLPSYQAIALCDQAAAIEILGMPFLTETYQNTFCQENYGALVQFGGGLWAGLARLAELDLDGLARLLSDPELQGGITNELVAPTLLLALEQEDPEAAAAIRALPWVEDGIENKPWGEYHEDEGLQIVDLVTLAWSSKQSIHTLLGKRWVQDGYDEGWRLYIATVLPLAAANDRAGTLVMEYFDQPGEPMYHMTLLMGRLMREDPDQFFQVLSSPELSDDDASGLPRAFLPLQILKQTNADAAATMEALPFIRDGIGPHEQDAVYWLWRIALESDVTLATLVNLPWVRDGLTPDELSATRILANMTGSYNAAVRNPLAAERIAGMPFLREVDSLDVAVLQALQNLESSWRPAWTSDREHLWQVLTHPSLRSSIDDTQRSVLAVSDVVALARPDLLDTLLNPRQTLVLERPITLPLADEVLLVTLWPDAPASQANALEEKALRTMNLLEHAVRHHEEFMGIPYPRKLVAALVMDVEEDIARLGDSELVLAIGVDPEFTDAGDVIARQAAYAYWPKSPDFRISPGWISEGASSFLAARAESIRLDAPLQEPTKTCDEFSSLRDLGAKKHDFGQYDESNTIFLTCDRALGEALFLGLFDALGILTFRQGFTTLSFVMQDVYQAESAGGFAPCWGATHWMFRALCYLDTAFQAREPTARAPGIRAAIEDLYGRD